jgi:hypothetical protein
MTVDTLYITMLGRSAWPLLNSYYAVIRETGLQPGRVLIFGEDVFSGQVPLVEAGLMAISAGYGFTPEVRVEQVPEADFRSAGEKISRAIREAKGAGVPVTMDITPGRKAMVAGALVHLSKIDIDHVYYLLIKSLDDAAKPYPMIPFQVQALKDLGGSKVREAGSSPPPVPQVMPKEDVERISAGELPLLLNLLGPRLKVSYPPTGVELVKAGVDGEGYRISLPSTSEEFDGASGVFGDLAHEVPGYDDLRACLIHAGILRFPNEDEFFEKSRARRQLKEDVVYALDTNLLYYGFPGNSGIDPSRFLIANATKRELLSASNLKYTPAQITTLRRVAPFHGELFDELVNQRPKKARKAAYLALREYELIRDRALEIGGDGDVSTDKEQNDVILVQSVRRYRGEKYALPVLLTADRNVTTLCNAEGLPCFLFEVPRDLSVRECTPARLANLVFDLAAVFGVIRLGSVLIYGEFRGKGSDLDELRLVFGDKKLAGTFARDLHVCRQLMALGIGE